MKQELYNLYLYLTRRDKSSVRLLCRFLSQKQGAERVLSVDNFPIDNNIKNAINQTLYDSRLEWELWKESFLNYEEFKISLRRRGYKGIPISSQPEIINSSSLFLNKVNPSSVMIRKKS